MPTFYAQKELKKKICFNVVLAFNVSSQDNWQDELYRPSSYIMQLSMSQIPIPGVN